MRLQKIVRNLLGMAACLYASAALADTAYFAAFVDRTLIRADDTYGGCMVLLSKNPADALPTCKNPWVTLSCSGTYTDPVRAYRMLDQAQLAIATGMKVLVVIDDTKTHDGYCFASRIDLLSN